MFGAQNAFGYASRQCSVGCAENGFWQRFNHNRHPKTVDKKISVMVRFFNLSCTRTQDVVPFMAIIGFPCGEVNVSDLLHKMQESVCVSSRATTQNAENSFIWSAKKVQVFCCRGRLDITVQRVLRCNKASLGPRKRCWFFDNGHSELALLLLVLENSSTPSPK